MQIRLTEQNANDLAKLDLHYTKTARGYKMSMAELANHLLAEVLDGLKQDIAEREDNLTPHSD